MARVFVIRVIVMIPVLSLYMQDRSNVVQGTSTGTRTSIVGHFNAAKVLTSSNPGQFLPSFSMDWTLPKPWQAWQELNWSDMSRKDNSFVGCTNRLRHVGDHRRHCKIGLLIPWSFDSLLDVHERTKSNTWVDDWCLILMERHITITQAMICAWFAGSLIWSWLKTG